MQVVQLIALLAALLFPGWIITFSFTNSYKLATSLALPVSAGMAYSLGNYSHLLNLPFGKSWVVIELLVAFLLGCILIRQGSLNGPKFSKVTIATSFITAGVSLILLRGWFQASGSFSQLLPNHDAMYHSYVIRNILNESSNSVRDALQIFPKGAGTAANFYPLGLHSILALGVTLSGLSINTSMNVVAIGLGVCAFPFSLASWMGTISRNNEKLILFSLPALLMVSTVFPLSPLSWGGMPVIVAMSLSPAIAGAVVEILNNGTKHGRFVIALAAVGIFSIHATELLTVVGLVLIAMIARGEFRVLRKWIWSLEPAWVGGYSFFMLIPVVMSVGGGAAERSLSYQPVLELTQTVGNFVLYSFSGFAMPFATILTAIGVLLAHRYRLTAVAFSFLFVGLLCVIAARFPTNSFVLTFTKPWYGQVLRLDYNVVYFAIPLIAVALSGIYELAKIRGSQLSIVKISFAVAIVALIAYVPLEQSASATSKLQESWYNGLIPVNQNSVAAFKWMSRNISSSEYVMTDVDGVDGSTWMYALANVKPVMYGAIATDERDRWRHTKNEIIGSVGHLSSKPNLLAWISKYKVKYFYFDERTNAISPEHNVSLENLRSENKLVEEFNKQNAHVFRFKTQAES